MGRDGSSRRTIRTAVIAVAALAALSAGRSADARPGAPGCGGGGPALLEKLERDLPGLGLDRTHLDAAYQVIDQARTERRALDAEVRSAHERMRALLEQDAPEADAVSAQADAIGALMTKVRKIELRAAIQVRGMLSAEQRSELDRRRAQHRPGRAPEG